MIQLDNSLFSGQSNDNWNNLKKTINSHIHFIYHFLI